MAAPPPLLLNPEGLEEDVGATPLCSHLACMRLPCGSLLQPGDDVFVLTPRGLRELHSCVVCGGPSRERAPLLECDRCLRGFHPACVNLPRVPPGEEPWDCPHCASLPGKRSSVCDVERLDQGLAFLARVEALWWDPEKGGVFFRARWYSLPAKHGTLTTTWWLRSHPELSGCDSSLRLPLREVAMGPPGDADTASLGAVLRPATVVRPERALLAAQEALSDGRPPPLVCHHILSAERWRYGIACGPRVKGGVVGRAAGTVKRHQVRRTKWSR